MQRRLTLLGVISVVSIGALVGAFILLQKEHRDPAQNGTFNPTVRVAVTPFPDVTQLVVGSEKRFFEDYGLSLNLFDATWDAQFDLLASGAVDVAISSVSELVLKDKNLQQINRRVEYFFPAWQFQGLVFVSRKDIHSLTDIRIARPSDENTAIREFFQQFSQKSIVMPEGSTYESGLNTLFEKAGLRRQNFRIINSELEAGLNALQDPGVGMVAVGAGQTIEALRRGYKIALDSTDLGVTVITGFIARRDFLERNPEIAARFVCGWYRTVSFMRRSPVDAYRIAAEYLTRRGASALSQSEYELAIGLSDAPASPPETASRFLQSSSRTYWGNAWHAAVANMRATGKSAEAPRDESSFIAAGILEQATQLCGHAVQ